MPLKPVKLLHPVSDHENNVIVLKFSCMCFICVGIEMPAAAKVTFDSSMSEAEFFKWLQGRGVSEKDCKILSGKIHTNY